MADDYESCMDICDISDLEMGFADININLQFEVLTTHELILLLSNGKNFRIFDRVKQVLMTRDDCCRNCFSIVNNGYHHTC